MRRRRVRRRSRGHTEPCQLTAAGALQHATSSWPLIFAGQLKGAAFRPVTFLCFPLPPLCSINMHRTSAGTLLIRRTAAKKDFTQILCCTRSVQGNDPHGDPDVENSTWCRRDCPRMPCVWEIGEAVWWNALGKNWKAGAALKPLLSPNGPICV